MTENTDENGDRHALERADVPASRPWRIWRGTIVASTAVAILAIAYYVLLGPMHLRNSAAFYVGLPMLLSLWFASLPPGRLAVVEALRVTTIFLLLSLPLLREGFVCVLMASPILYGVAALLGLLVDAVRTRLSSRVRSSALLLPLALLALEGTHPALTFEREHMIAENRVVDVSHGKLVDALARAPTFRTPAPWSARVFPSPSRAFGGGLTPGDTRVVEFVYYKHVWFNRHEGRTVFRVTGNDGRCVSFDIPSDTSYIEAYLGWRASVVCLEPVDANRTRISWRLGWHRKLDPAWYFQPLQDYYVRLTARQLIDNLADAAR